MICDIGSEVGSVGTDFFCQHLKINKLMEQINKILTVNQKKLS